MVESYVMISPRSLLVGLSLSLLFGVFGSSCSSLDSQQAMADLSPGQKCRIAEMKAALYWDSPGAETPQSILDHGTIVTVVEAGPTYSVVDTPVGQGYVSSFGLIPLRD